MPPRSDAGTATRGALRGASRRTGQAPAGPHERACAPCPPPRGSQIVTVKRFGKKYVLYQCGTPDPSSLPPGAAPGVTPGLPSFEVPLYSVAVTDTTVNGFLVGAFGWGF
jgi:hypothetical protein